MANILDRAADLVERGWVQEHFVGTAYHAGGQPVTGFCAVGAMRAAVGLQANPELDPVEAYRIATNSGLNVNLEYQRAQQLVIELIHSRSIPAWNDHWDRRKEQVVDTLRRAARIYDERFPQPEPAKEGLTHIEKILPEKELVDA